MGCAEKGIRLAADKQAHGVRGYVRITEVVHSPAMGWHVHFHVILLLDRELDQLAMDGLKASRATRFARGVARCGGYASVDGQDLRPMAAGTEERLASCLAALRPNDASPNLIRRGAFAQRVPPRGRALGTARSTSGTGMSSRWSSFPTRPGEP